MNTVEIALTHRIKTYCNPRNGEIYAKSFANVRSIRVFDEDKGRFLAIGKDNAFLGAHIERKIQALRFNVTPTEEEIVAAATTAIMTLDSVESADVYLGDTYDSSEKDLAGIQEELF